MTLNQLFDKFLPDFHTRILSAKAEHPEWTAEQEARFIANIFPEALQNFADIICEKQRINAIKAFFELDKTQLMEVPFIEQPKIEEL